MTSEHRETTVAIEGVEIRTEYQYWGPHPGTFERGSGVPLTPPEPATVGIERLYIGGVEVTDLLIEDFGTDIERLVLDYEANREE